jgi:hypothetical protein
MLKKVALGTLAALVALFAGCVNKTYVSERGPDSVAYAEPPVRRVNTTRTVYVRPAPRHEEHDINVVTYNVEAENVEAEKDRW